MPMEGLKKLEQVQKTISLMQSHRIIDSSKTNPHSDRFIANFVLFLGSVTSVLATLERDHFGTDHEVSQARICEKAKEFASLLILIHDMLKLQPCAELDMDMKCQLIAEHSNKISAAFLEEALLHLGGEGEEQIENVGPIYSDSELGCMSLQTNTKVMAMVGLDAMQRANSTLEDFCRSYFMFHEMDVNKPQSIFRHLPVLSFTESYIYQMDTLNEKLSQLPRSVFRASQKGSDVTREANQSSMCKLIELFRSDPLRPLVLRLADSGLLTDRIRKELESGEEYWALERKLCRALTTKKEISIQDVMRAMHLKSFDYRVLNLLLYQLRGEKVNELHMEFLSISEFLVELADDLFDYEDDVIENSFNILRMFVRIYGASTAPTMLAKCIGEAEEKYELLLKALDAKLLLNYQKRCEEATREGGKMSGPSLGTWNIPPVIEDEDFYRTDIMNSKQV